MNKPQKFIYRELPEAQTKKLLRVLKREGSIKVNGLGIFEVRQRRASKIVDNINNKVVKVSARKSILFKPTTQIKNYINGRKTNKKA